MEEFNSALNALDFINDIRKDETFQENGITIRRGLVSVFSIGEINRNVKKYGLFASEIGEPYHHDTTLVINMKRFFPKAITRKFTNNQINALSRTCKTLYYNVPDDAPIQLIDGDLLRVDLSNFHNMGEIIINESLPEPVIQIIKEIIHSHEHITVTPVGLFLKVLMTWLGHPAGY